MAPHEPKSFPINLDEALVTFAENLTRLGGSLTKVPPDPAIPDETINIGRVGPPHAKRVVLHVAGTHGVEGFLGAAIQDRILGELNAQGPASMIPPNTAVVMVRCLNPWGMRNLRRVNRANVDLNRNFVPQGQCYAGAPDAYRALRLFCNPRHPPARFTPFLPAALLQIAKHGFSTLKQALTGGQYEFPEGVYFGGRELQGESRVMLELLQSFASVEILDAIEVHSGLGPWGHDTIFFQGNDAARAKRLEEIAERRLEGDDPTLGVGIRTEADLMRAALRVRGAQRTSWMLQEFGTYGPITMFAALRAENGHHQFGNGHSPAHWSKRRLMERFNPRSESWRKKVVKRGAEFFWRVLGLAD